MVKEIATTNNMDLFKIRNMMLEKWICKTGPAVTKVSPSELSFILVPLCFPVKLKFKLCFNTLGGLNPFYLLHCRMVVLLSVSPTLRMIQI